jgi:hypothetical protein
MNMISGYLRTILATCLECSSIFQWVPAPALTREAALQNDKVQTLRKVDEDDQAVKSGGQRLGLSSTTLGCHSIRVVYITDNCSVTTVYIPSYGGYYYILPINNPNFTPNHFRLFASSWDLPLLTRVL